MNLDFSTEQQHPLFDCQLCGVHYGYTVRNPWYWDTWPPHTLNGNPGNQIITVLKIPHFVMSVEN